LDKAKGNYGKAIEKFGEELKECRKICDVKTICMHGNPLSRWTNKDVWAKYDFNDFDIIGGLICQLTSIGLRISQTPEEVGVQIDIE
jgi:hypothetical protein